MIKLNTTWNWANCFLANENWCLIFVNPVSSLVSFCELNVSLHTYLLVDDRAFTLSRPHLKFSFSSSPGWWFNLCGILWSSCMTISLSQILWSPPQCETKQISLIGNSEFTIGVNFNVCVGLFRKSLWRLSNGPVWDFYNLLPIYHQYNPQLWIIQNRCSGQMNETYIDGHAHHKCISYTDFIEWHMLIVFA